MGQVTLPAVPTNLNTYDLIFEATIGNGIFGNLAIDDVYFASGATCEYFNSSTTTQPTTTVLPPSTLECSFEKDFCEWIVDDSAPNAKWIRKNGRLSQYGTAPLNDVTLQNSLGFYAYVDSSPNGALSRALLKSPVITYDIETCLEFWYQLGGPINAALTVAMNDQSNSRAELWKRNGNQADTWSHAYVRIAQNFTGKWVEFAGLAIQII